MGKPVHLLRVFKQALRSQTRNPDINGERFPRTLFHVLAITFHNS